jgi:hypothetical protein
MITNIVTQALAIVVRLRMAETMEVDMAILPVLLALLPGGKQLMALHIPYYLNRLLFRSLHEQGRILRPLPALDPILC